MNSTTTKRVAYSGPEFQTIAEQNTVLRGQVGSGLHGVTTGADDRDEMGVCIEPPDYVIGNARFEQYQFRTQPEGVRSGAGDLDLVVYSLRKWARLTAAGNPTVLLLLFLPKHEIVTNTWVGQQLQANPEMFISQQAGHRFIGYLESQRDKMLGLRAQRTNRPELVDVHGFDTKFAYHAVRLGLQGVELLTNGRITLPIPEPDRTWLRELRNGEHSLDEALDRMRDLKDQINRLIGCGAWAKHADPFVINGWLSITYLRWWEEKGLI
ncbi:nucleotidyltransferase [Rhodococcus zopfii]|uniref:Nucleotidyltransferase n=1 Tax=Rhodococcus zopfii TaxID=43772 RepID=A0ABU3WT42_9NOCA|nr:nucleotidyltransferase [Rhodococcus zopfii]MDV2477403.1 nucleotidyltransferase [Rhodococcus zopfii]MDV2477453.1 nucleotidyltransferase [Rhodococcus zopfii]